MNKPGIGLVGATSLVGKCLIPLLINSGSNVFAFTRKEIISNQDALTWCNISDKTPENIEEINYWICIAPIWVLENYFHIIQASGARRLVALSSTSCFTKDDSTDPVERDTALKLAEAESRLRAWAESRGVEWIILRPTLIYGLGIDKNITEIARFILRFGFFPMFGQSTGLRQPIHSQDVASVCFGALYAVEISNRAYNISGGDTLTFREMVARVFIALGRRPRLLAVPLWLFHLAVIVFRFLPRYRQWSVNMAQRMNQDMAFSHEEAIRDLGFKPRNFILKTEDLP